MTRKIRVLLGGSEGNMGRTLQKEFLKCGDIEVAHRFDPKLEEFQSFSDVVDQEEQSINKAVDVYLDFTTPTAVMNNIKQVSEADIDSIIGTTGWYNQIDEVRDLAIRLKRRIMYAPNFSPGINTFFYITRVTARLLQDYGYDALVREVHHTKKRDAPSGTAITLGNILRDEMGTKDRLAYERRGKRLNTEIDVVGSRVGEVAGHHEVWFTSEGVYAERLILQHDVFTREAFSRGVIMGIRWMTQAQEKNKAAGLYSFYRDVLGMVE